MFDTKQIDLSMRNPDTGRFLQANVYFVEGVRNADGSYRELSIGQLVMAICLARATEVEQALVLKMDALNQSSTLLDSLTSIETKITETAAKKTYGDSIGAKWSDIGCTKAEEAAFRKLYDTDSWVKFVTDYCGVPPLPNFDADNGYSLNTIDTVLTSVESRMDDLNTQNQSDMIEMQSLTNKRDQAYDLNAALIKSFQTVIIGTIANMR